MDSEAQIVEKLKQNVTPQATTVLAPIAPPSTDNGQAVVASKYPLDEMVQYKLHDYFGEQYKPNDEEARQRLEYIYTQVSELVGEQDYGIVLAKIRNLEDIIGTNYSDNRIYKVYQWLKLDKARRSIDAEMGALSL